MDIDAYSLGLLVETRLAEARAQSARYALLRSVGAGRADMLTVFGLGLIKMGRRLDRRPARGRRRTRLATLPAP